MAHLSSNSLLIPSSSQNASSAASTAASMHGMSVRAEDVLQPFMNDLRSRSSDARQYGSNRLDAWLSNSYRELSVDHFHAIVNNINKHLFTLVNGADTGGKLAAIAMMDMLLPLSYEDIELKVQKYASYLRMIYTVKVVTAATGNSSSGGSGSGSGSNSSSSNSSNQAVEDYELLVRCSSSALARMCLVAGAAAADVLSAELRKCLEWLEHQPDRRFCALTLIQEFTLHVSPMFAAAAAVDDFLNTNWFAMRDSRIGIRQLAAKTLGVVMNVVCTRAPQLRAARCLALYARAKEHATADSAAAAATTATAATAAATATETVHAGLLAFGPLLTSATAFSLKHIQELGDHIWQRRDHRERVVRLEVIALLPLLAAVDGDMYYRHYISHVINAIKSSNTASSSSSHSSNSSSSNSLDASDTSREVCFQALGELAKALGARVQPHLADIIELIQEALLTAGASHYGSSSSSSIGSSKKHHSIIGGSSSSSSNNSSSSSNHYTTLTQSHKIADTAVLCLSQLAQAAGDLLHKHIHTELLDLLLYRSHSSLSPSLVNALASLCGCVPQLQSIVQPRLLTVVSNIFQQQQYSSSAAAAAMMVSPRPSGSSSSSSNSSSSSGIASLASASLLAPALTVSQPNSSSKQQLQQQQQAQGMTAFAPSRSGHHNNSTMNNSSNNNGSILLALQCLAVFPFAAASVAQLLRTAVLAQLEVTEPSAVRHQAVKTVIALLHHMFARRSTQRGSNSSSSNSFNSSNSSSSTVNTSLVTDVLQRLLQSCLADSDSSLRLMIAQKLLLDMPELDDWWLGRINGNNYSGSSSGSFSSSHYNSSYGSSNSSSSMLPQLCVVLQDESLMVREAAMQTLGRLATKHPALVMPHVRTVLLSLLSQLQQASSASAAVTSGSSSSIINNTSDHHSNNNNTSNINDNSENSPAALQMRSQLSNTREACIRLLRHLLRSSGSLMLPHVPTLMKALMPRVLCDWDNRVTTVALAAVSEIAIIAGAGVATSTAAAAAAATASSENRGGYSDSASYYSSGEDSASAGTDYATAAAAAIYTQLPALVTNMLGLLSPKQDITVGSSSNNSNNYGSSIANNSTLQQTLQAFVTIIKHTGYVITPYSTHPQLLPTLLSLLKTSSNSDDYISSSSSNNNSIEASAWLVRREVLRLIGTLGAWDPAQFKLQQQQLEQLNNSSSGNNNSGSSSDQIQRLLSSSPMAGPAYNQQQLLLQQTDLIPSINPHFYFPVMAVTSLMRLLLHSMTLSPQQQQQQQQQQLSRMHQRSKSSNVAFNNSSSTGTSISTSHKASLQQACMQIVRTSVNATRNNKQLQAQTHEQQQLLPLLLPLLIPTMLQVASTLSDGSGSNNGSSSRKNSMNLNSTGSGSTSSSSMDDAFAAMIYSDVIVLITIAKHEIHPWLPLVYQLVRSCWPPQQQQQNQQQLLQQPQLQTVKISQLLQVLPLLRCVCTSAPTVFATWLPSLLPLLLMAMQLQQPVQLPSNDHHHHSSYHNKHSSMMHPLTSPDHQQHQQLVSIRVLQLLQSTGPVMLRIHAHIVLPAIFTVIAQQQALVANLSSDSSATAAVVAATVATTTAVITSALSTLSRLIAGPQHHSLQHQMPTAAVIDVYAYASRLVQLLMRLIEQVWPTLAQSSNSSNSSSSSGGSSSHSKQDSSSNSSSSSSSVSLVISSPPITKSHSITQNIQNMLKSPTAPSNKLVVASSNSNSSNNISGASSASSSGGSNSSSSNNSNSNGTSNPKLNAVVVDAALSMMSLLLFQWQLRFLIFVPVVQNTLTRASIKHKRYEAAVYALLHDTSNNNSSSSSSSNITNQYSRNSSSSNANIDSLDDASFAGNLDGSSDLWSDGNNSSSTAATAATVTVNGYNNYDKLPINFVALQAAWDCSAQRHSSSNNSNNISGSDWYLWHRGFALALLRESPLLVFRHCSAAAARHTVIASDHLFFPAFLCVWQQLPDRYQDDLASTLSYACSSSSLPSAVAAVLLGLAEYMEKHAAAASNNTTAAAAVVPVPWSCWAKLAERQCSYAKALRYEEGEEGAWMWAASAAINSSNSSSSNSNSNCATGSITAATTALVSGNSSIESMLALHHHLQQPDAATGLLVISSAAAHSNSNNNSSNSDSNNSDTPVINATWYEALNRWEDALHAHEQQQLLLPSPSSEDNSMSLTVARMRCLRALGEWERLDGIAVDAWATVQQQQQQQLALVQQLQQQTLPQQQQQRGASDITAAAIAAAAATAMLKRELAPLAAAAALTFARYHQLPQYLAHMDDNNTHTCFARAAAAISSSSYAEAYKQIDGVRRLIEPELVALTSGGNSSNSNSSNSSSSSNSGSGSSNSSASGNSSGSVISSSLGVIESYQRSYRLIVLTQQAEELEEVMEMKMLKEAQQLEQQPFNSSSSSSINYAHASIASKHRYNSSYSVARQQQLLRMWSQRLLCGVQQDVDVWMTLLTSRTPLLLSINAATAATAATLKLSLCSNPLTTSNSSNNDSSYGSCSLPSLSRMPPSMHIWLKFASLCRRSSRFSLSLRVHTRLMLIDVHSEAYVSDPSRVVDAVASSYELHDSSSSRYLHPLVIYSYTKHLWAAGEQTEAYCKLLALTKHSLFASLTPDNSSSSCDISSYSYSNNSSSGNSSAFNVTKPQAGIKLTRQELHRLNAKAHIKLGQWQLAMAFSSHSNGIDSSSSSSVASNSTGSHYNNSVESDQQSSRAHQLNEYVLKDVLSSFATATRFAATSYKAWHHYAYINYRAVGHYKQQQTGCKERLKVKRQQLQQLLESSSKVAKASADEQSASSLQSQQQQQQHIPPQQQEQEVTMTTAAIEQLQQQIKYFDTMIEQHVVPAIRGFFASVTYASGSNENNSNSNNSNSNSSNSNKRRLQDVLRLLSLWFTYGMLPCVQPLLQSGFASLPASIWLPVIPQIVARVDVQSVVVREWIAVVLREVGVQHPQSLLYPLVVAAATAATDNNSSSNTAVAVLQHMRQHSPVLVSHALLVSAELVRVSVLWHEQWHDSLEEASKVWFSGQSSSSNSNDKTANHIDSNNSSNNSIDQCSSTIAAFVEILAPLHQALLSPTTLHETAFAHKYGQQLVTAWRWVTLYADAVELQQQQQSSSNNIISTASVDELPVSHMSQAWDLYLLVYKELNHAHKQQQLKNNRAAAASPVLVNNNNNKDVAATAAAATAAAAAAAAAHEQHQYLDLQHVAPALLHARNLLLAMPGTYLADRDSSNSSSIRIHAFLPSVKIINSKQQPRQLHVVGDDGNAYSFLLKGHEDLRQDQRVMQLLVLVNQMQLSSNNHSNNSSNSSGEQQQSQQQQSQPQQPQSQHHSTNNSDLSITTYSVIPLSLTSGLIQWLAHCDTLHSVITSYRRATHKRLHVEHMLIAQAASSGDNSNNRGARHHHSTMTKLQRTEVFESVLRQTRGEELSRVLWLTSTSTEHWLARRTNHTRSLAVMSAVGYTLGLGDRHPCNLMLNRRTGSSVHIDFGDCFEVARTRRLYAETVPFRLTRMLRSAMDVSGVEGVFRLTCVATMQLLREQKESVMAVLEALVYEPLTSWRLMEARETKQRQMQQQQQQQQTANTAAAAAVIRGNLAAQTAAATAGTIDKSRNSSSNNLAQRAIVRNESMIRINSDNSINNSVSNSKRNSITGFDDELNHAINAIQIDTLGTTVNLLQLHSNNSIDNTNDVNDSAAAAAIVLDQQQSMIVVGSMMRPSSPHKRTSSTIASSKHRRQTSRGSIVINNTAHAAAVAIAAAEANHIILDSANDQSAHNNSNSDHNNSSSIATEADAEDEENNREVLNARALEVMSRIDDKLSGRDFNARSPAATTTAAVLSVDDQVQLLLLEATSNYNLAQCYIGWCAFW